MQQICPHRPRACVHKTHVKLSPGRLTVSATCSSRLRHASCAVRAMVLHSAHIYRADVALATPVAVCSSNSSSAAWVPLPTRRGRNCTPPCLSCGRARTGRSVKAPAPRAAAEQAQIGLALVDDIEREYFREFKSGSERGIVPAPADFFELVRDPGSSCPGRLPVEPAKYKAA